MMFRSGSAVKCKKKRKDVLESYDSFGNLSTSTGMLANPFQYTGRDSDPETGLRYYRARYYDSITGRFLSEDPVRFSAGNDFYAYVGNGPTNFIDPSGLAKLHFWASTSKRWGHVSLTLNDGTHISFFPIDYKAIKDWDFSVPGTEDLKRAGVGVYISPPPAPEPHWVK
jgi:RHS repeat-associated protein